MGKQTVPFSLQVKAITLAYETAKKAGYGGSQTEFIDVLNNNDQARELAYTDAQNNGYGGTIDDFSSLIGVPKKKSQPVQGDPPQTAAQKVASQSASLSGGKPLSAGDSPPPFKGIPASAMSAEDKRIGKGLPERKQIYAGEQRDFDIIPKEGKKESEIDRTLDRSTAFAPELSLNDARRLMDDVNEIKDKWNALKDAGETLSRKEFIDSQVAGGKEMNARKHAITSMLIAEDQNREIDNKVRSKVSKEIGYEIKSLDFNKFQKDLDVLVEDVNAKQKAMAEQWEQLFNQLHQQANATQDPIILQNIEKQFNAEKVRYEDAVNAIGAQYDTAYKELLKAYGLEIDPDAEDGEANIKYNDKALDTYQKLYDEEVKRMEHPTFDPIIPDMAWQMQIVDGRATGALLSSLWYRKNTKAGRGATRTVLGLASSVPAFTAMVSKKEETQDKLLDVARNIKQSSLEYTKDTDIMDISEVKTFADFANYSAGNIGMILPMMGTFGAAGVIGATVAKGAGSIVAKQVSKKMLSKKGVNLLTAGGSYTGSFLYGWQSYTGSLYSDIADMGGDHSDAKKAALQYGAVASGVSVIMPSVATSYLMGAFGKTYTRNYLNSMIKGAGLGMLQAPAEMLAEASVIMGEQVVLGRVYSQDEIRNRINNAGAAASYLGVVPGVVIPAIGKGGAITGSISDAIDVFLKTIEPNARMAAREDLIGYYVKNLQQVKNPTSIQQEFLGFLQNELQAPTLFEKAVTPKKDSSIEQIITLSDKYSIEAVERSTQENIQRIDELLEIALKGELTMEQAIELTAISANSPNARNAIMFQNWGVDVLSTLVENEISVAKKEGRTIDEATLINDPVKYFEGQLIDLYIEEATSPQKNRDYQVLKKDVLDNISGAVQAMELLGREYANEVTTVDLSLSGTDKTDAQYKALVSPNVNKIQAKIQGRNAQIQARNKEHQAQQEAALTPEVQSEIDLKVEQQQQKLGTETTPEVFISEETTETLSKIDNNEPVINSRLEQAANNLYQEYKRLHEMTKMQDRKFTLGQITAEMNRLGEQITLLNTLMGEQSNIGDFVQDVSEIKESIAEQVEQVQQITQEETKDEITEEVAREEEALPKEEVEEVKVEEEQVESALDKLAALEQEAPATTTKKKVYRGKAKNGVTPEYGEWHTESKKQAQKFSEGEPQTKDGVPIPLQEGEVVDVEIDTEKMRKTNLSMDVANTGDQLVLGQMSVTGAYTVKEYAQALGLTEKEVLGAIEGRDKEYLENGILKAYKVFQNKNIQKLLQEKGYEGIEAFEPSLVKTKKPSYLLFPKQEATTTKKEVKVEAPVKEEAVVAEKPKEEAIDKKQGVVQEKKAPTTKEEKPVKKKAEPKKKIKPTADALEREARIAKVKAAEVKGEKEDDATAKKEEKKRLNLTEDERNRATVSDFLNAKNGFNLLKEMFKESGLLIQNIPFKRGILVSTDRGQPLFNVSNEYIGDRVLDIINIAKQIESKIVELKEKGVDVVIPPNAPMQVKYQYFSDSPKKGGVIVMYGERSAQMVAKMPLNDLINEIKGYTVKAAEVVAEKPTTTTKEELTPKERIGDALEKIVSSKGWIKKATGEQRDSFKQGVNELLSAILDQMISDAKKVGKSINITAQQVWDKAMAKIRERNLNIPSDVLSDVKAEYFDKFQSPEKAEQPPPPKKEKAEGKGDIKTSKFIENLSKRDDAVGKVIYEAITESSDAGAYKELSRAEVLTQAAELIDSHVKEGKDGSIIYDTAHAELLKESMVSESPVRQVARQLLMDMYGREMVRFTEANDDVGFANMHKHMTEMYSVFQKDATFIGQASAHTMWRFIPTIAVPNMVKQMWQQHSKLKLGVDKQGLNEVVDDMKKAIPEVMEALRENKELQEIVSKLTARVRALEKAKGKPYRASHKVDGKQKIAENLAKLDKLKLPAGTMFADIGLVAIWNGMVEVVKKTYAATGSLYYAVSDALKNINTNDPAWKEMSQKEQQDFIEKFKTDMADALEMDVTTLPTVKALQNKKPKVEKLPVITDNSMMKLMIENVIQMQIEGNSVSKESLVDALVNQGLSRRDAQKIQDIVHNELMQRVDKIFEKQFSKEAKAPPQSRKKAAKKNFADYVLMGILHSDAYATAFLEQQGLKTDITPQQVEEIVTAVENVQNVIKSGMGNGIYHLLANNHLLRVLEKVSPKENIIKLLLNYGISSYYAKMLGGLPTHAINALSSNIIPTLMPFFEAVDSRKWIKTIDAFRKGDMEAVEKNNPLLRLTVSSYAYGMGANVGKWHFLSSMKGDNITERGKYFTGIVAPSHKIQIMESHSYGDGKPMPTIKIKIKDKKGRIKEIDVNPQNYLAHIYKQSRRVMVGTDASTRMLGYYPELAITLTHVLSKGGAIDGQYAGQKLTGKKLRNEVRRLMTEAQTDVHVQNEIEAQVQKEAQFMRDLGFDIKRHQMKMRAAEIAMNRMPITEEQKAEAMELAAANSFQDARYGVFSQLANGLIWLQNQHYVTRLIVMKYVPFLRMLGTIGDFIMDTAVGGLRAKGLGATGMTYRVIHAIKEKRLGAIIDNPTEVGYRTSQMGIKGSRRYEQQMARQMVGLTLLTIGFMALAKGSDDYDELGEDGVLEFKNYVSGSLRHLTPEQRRRHPLGQYVLRINGVNIRYKSIPILSFALNAIGNYNDELEAGTSSDKALARLGIFARAWGTSFWDITDSTFYSGLEGMINELSDILFKGSGGGRRTDPDKRLQDMSGAKALKKTGKGYLEMGAGMMTPTRHNLFQNVMKVMDSDRRYNNTPEQLLFHMTGLSYLSDDKMIDWDGSTIKSFPGSRHFYFPAQRSEMYDILFKYGIDLAPIRITTKHNLINREEGIRESRPMNGKEYQPYVEMAVDIWKTRFWDYMSANKETLESRHRVPSEDYPQSNSRLQSDIRKINVDAKKQARQIMFTYDTKYKKELLELAKKGAFPSPLESATFKVLAANLPPELRVKELTGEDITRQTIPYSFKQTQEINDTAMELFMAWYKEDGVEKDANVINRMWSAYKSKAKDQLIRKHLAEYIENHSGK